ncbi:hypothetical protein EGW08_004398 [Elysia chlorotica]|uniref:Reverse transcriptase domain-containing protein n=1 Tax=Elysia chlorotica TaxID=188477 RepID=A0A3S0ZWN9_ELYCH|nr:hypothetical protein EGW08_004398 [Elysia chlorotica]
MAFRAKFWNGSRHFCQKENRVVVNGTSSKPAPVTSGIPQGSVVGPMLFVMYINDLPDVCTSNVKLFADDTKLFTRSDDEAATTVMQEDLNRLQQWSNDWLLRFHPQKCSVLKLGSKKSGTKYTMKKKGNGENHEIVLGEHDVEKDLGVYVDNDLSFKEHVSRSTTRANKVVAIIRRTFDFLTEDLLVCLLSIQKPDLDEETDRHLLDADNNDMPEFGAIDIEVADTEWMDVSPDFTPQRHNFSGGGGINFDDTDFKEIDYVSQFLDDEFWSLVAIETNRKADQFFEGEPTLGPRSIFRSWYETNPEEMRKFIGLILLMGLVKKHDGANIGRKIL